MAIGDPSPGAAERGSERYSTFAPQVYLRHTSAACLLHGPAPAAVGCHIRTASDIARFVKSQARSWSRMGAALGAVLALLTLVGVAALATNGVPGALMQHQPAKEALMQYQPASDWDGAYAVRYIPLSHVQQGQQHQQSLVNAEGAWKLVNKCSLFGCHTVRVPAGKGRKLEAEHEARLRSMKERQDAKLRSQRKAMEMELHERRAVVPSDQREGRCGTSRGHQGRGG